MRRGEIWWAHVPMRGVKPRRRPMVLVSHDAFCKNPHYTKVCAVHLTSVQRLGGPYDWEVQIPKGTGGLARTSIAKCGEIYTLWKEQLQGPAGTVPARWMEAIDRALTIALGLPSPLDHCSTD